MTKSLTTYRDELGDFVKRLRKRMDEFDRRAANYVCFVAGVIFAAWFPKFTKKHKDVFVVVGILLMIPTIVKAVGILRKMFSSRR